MVSNLVVCGGTFDNLHKGHEKFLSFALSIGKKVLVGLMSDKYVQKSKLRNQNSKKIESYDIRKKNLEKFLIQNKVKNRVSILKINDLFGPTLTKDLIIDAIVVSEDTKRGADIINQKRSRMGLNPIKIFIAPFIKAENGEIISSAKIRDGLITKDGKLYVKPLWLETDLVLQDNLRKELHKPFGELLSNTDNLLRNNDNMVVVVGDITTKTFNEKSLGQNISIIDFRVNRKQRFFNISELGFSEDEKVLMVDNPSGSITKNLIRKLSEILTKRIDATILQINGEEDLAVLPLVLLAPLGTIIYYGQPNEGLVRVTVSKEAKDKAYNIFLKLKQA
jgi:pantetheine-phosphate adenylyltransferase